MVMISHTYKLSGSDFDPFMWIWPHTMGGLGVIIFFIISGFLITKSWWERPNLIQYFKNRALRIIPALAVSTLLCAFVIGPIVTSLNLREYFLHPWTRHYLKNIELYAISYNLPGVFENNPMDSVNGSLWTLTVEFYCYILIAILGVLGIMSRKKIFFLLGPTVLAVDIFLTMYPKYFNMVVLHMVAGMTSWCLIFFMAGSMLYIYREIIPFDGRIALILFLLYTISWPLKWGHYVGFFTLPYIVIYLAYLKLPLVNNLGGKIGDFSYGMYIYAFPIQQSLVYFSEGRMYRLVLFMLSFVVTLILSVCSWYFIERPALGLKKVKLIRFF